MNKPYHELRDDEKTPVHLDAGENCDWPKRTWDLGRPTRRNMTWVLFNIIAGGWGPNQKKTPEFVQSRLDIFMNTPAGRGMPEPHRARLRGLGWRVE
jgi:hypothetical protein